MPPSSERLCDRFGRVIDYLRLSVTDQCNLCCPYCRPAGGHPSRAEGPLLTDDEIVGLLQELVALGIGRVRITGGEPLLRPRLPDLVARIAAMDGVRDLSLTTNGILLPGRAAELRRAGLQRINISLDTLQRERFRKISGQDALTRVLAGVQEALTVGLSPVKLNVVVMRGLNDDELPHFARLTQGSPIHVRFIELMPIGEARSFSGERHVSIAEMKRRIGSLEKVSDADRPTGWGPAVYFRKPGALGTLGFIGAMTDRFCHSCNRLRLTSGGTLLSCLAQSGQGMDLRPLLGHRRSLRAAVRQVVLTKGEGHRMHQPSGELQRRMCSVGG